jgi:hypothetical protein
MLEDGSPGARAVGLRDPFLASQKRFVCGAIALQNGGSLQIFPPNMAVPFIDHSSEVWNFGCRLVG